MEPIEYLRILRRRWMIVAAAVLLALAVAFITTPSSSADQPAQRVTYSATHTLIQDRSVVETGTTGGSLIIGLDLLALLTTTGEIPERVVERLDSNEPPAVLASRVVATPNAELGTLTVSSTGTDGEEAARLANAFGEEALAYVEDEAERVRQEAIEDAELLAEEQQKEIRRLARRQNSIRDRLQGTVPAEQLAETVLQDPDYQLAEAEQTAKLTEFNATTLRITQLNAQIAQGSGLYTLEEAVPVPQVEEGFQPPSSRRGRAGLAAMVGLALGIGLVLVLERVDTRVRTRRGAEEAFGLPVVAEIPRLRKRALADSPLILRSQPSSPAAEAYRILRLGLQLMPRWILPVSPHDPADLAESENGLRRIVGEAPSAILVTSPSEGEGKTTTALNLAASFAEIGKNVLLLDCDFRNPQLHRHLQVDPAPGVTDYLLPEDERPKLHPLAQASPIEGVWVVPSGHRPVNPGEVIEPGQDLISRARTLADVVIVDAGPMLSVNDPSALLPETDAVVLVARSGRTTADDALHTREQLSRLGAPLLGVTLVGVPGSSLSNKPGYRYFSNLPLGFGRTGSRSEKRDARDKATDDHESVN